MRARIPVIAVAFGAMLAASLIQAAPASAQFRIGVGIGYYYGGPFYGPRYAFGWYPGFYYGYPFYGAPYYGYYGAPFYGYGYPGAYPYYYNYGGSLRLQVTPREAEVFVDGYFAGTVDDFDGTFQRLDVEPGEHDVELYLPGHRSVQRKLYLQPGKTTSIKLAMQALAPGDPEPVRPVGVPTASRNDARYSVTPRPRREPPTDDDVRPVEPRRNGDATYGSLSIRVQPGDAEILIDGERWEGAATTERFVVGLSAGRHVIEIQKPGFRRYTTEVTVRNGVTTPLNVLLTPSP